MSFKKSILFVSNAASWPLTDGKRQRTWFLLEALSKSYEVDFLFLGFKAEKDLIEQNTNNYRKLFFIELTDSILLNPSYPEILLSTEQRRKKIAFKDKVTNLFQFINGEDYQFVFARYLYALGVLPIKPSLKIACDIDDVFFETFASRFKAESNFIKKNKILFHHLIALRNNINLLKRVDVSFVVKDADKKYFGLKHAICLPNLPFGYFLDKQPVATQNTKLNGRKIITFGFLGKLSYRPNYQGLIYFINEVWNPLMQDEIDAQFIIAGSGDCPACLLNTISSSKKIDFLGFVERADDFWKKVDVLIVPVNEGGGTNIKIAEALMYGKKVIASIFSARGFEKFLEEGELIAVKKNKDWRILIKQFIDVKEINSVKISAKAQKTFDVVTWNKILYSHLEDTPIYKNK